MIWLLGLGALLFWANVTSTLLGHVAATRRQPAFVVIGLAAVGVLTLYATAFLRWTARVLECVGVVGFCMLIVLAGNTL